jgi:hypothetical protein
MTQFSDLGLLDQRTITATLVAEAPASWHDSLLAAILAQLPPSPTHKQIVDATTMALAAVGLDSVMGLGLNILTGSDVLPAVLGAGNLTAAASIT